MRLISKDASSGGRGPAGRVIDAVFTPVRSIGEFFFADRPKQPRLSMALFLIGYLLLTATYMALGAAPAALLFRLFGDGPWTFLGGLAWTVIVGFLVLPRVLALRRSADLTARLSPLQAQAKLNRQTRLAMRAAAVGQAFGEERDGHAGHAGQGKFLGR